MRDWSLITCPHCDFEQSVADECARCGVIFAKLRKAVGGRRSAPAAAGQIYHPSLPPGAISVREARLEIQLFLFLTLLFSAPLYWAFFLAVIHGWQLPVEAALFVGLFQWAPGTAAIVTRMLRGRDPRGFGWGWGKTHVYFSGAIVAPFLLAPLVYLPIWAFGFGAIDLAALDEATSWLGREGWGGAALFLLPVLAATLGEEVGWRGLLTPQLCRVTSPAKASLLTGLVWAAWHYPLAAVQVAYYRSDIPIWYALSCFTATVVGLSFLFTWLRIRSQSLWPVVLLHVSCNGAHIGLDALMERTTPLASYITTQNGVGFVVVTWLFVGFFWWRQAPLAANVRRRRRSSPRLRSAAIPDFLQPASSLARR